MFMVALLISGDSTVIEPVFVWLLRTINWAPPRDIELEVLLFSAVIYDL